MTLLRRTEPSCIEANAIPRQGPGKCRTRQRHPWRSLRPAGCSTGLKRYCSSPLQSTHYPHHYCWKNPGWRNQPRTDPVDFGKLSFPWNCYRTSCCSENSAVQSFPGFRKNPCLSHCCSFEPLRRRLPPAIPPRFRANVSLGVPFSLIGRRVKRYPDPLRSQPSLDALKERDREDGAGAVGETFKEGLVPVAPSQLNKRERWRQYGEHSKTKGAGYLGTTK